MKYRGFAARLSNRRFAWKVISVNLFWMIGLSLFLMWNSSTEGGVAVAVGETVIALSAEERAEMCAEGRIEWSEFITHSCESKNLWILIDGTVYDVWPWGKRVDGGITHSLGSSDH